MLEAIAISGLSDIATFFVETAVFCETRLTRTHGTLVSPNPSLSTRDSLDAGISTTVAMADAK